MPKAWSEREKEFIKKTLLSEGKTLFEKYGLHKTTVDEIVNAAQISKGSFYIFYQSKEELYFDVLDSVEQELREKIFENLFKPELDRRDSFKSFLLQMVEILTTMPIYEQMNAANYELLLRKLPEETLQNHMNRDQENLAKYFVDWMDKGWMRKVDPDALNGLLLALIQFVMHREEFGENFEATKELWIEAISYYLITDDQE
jgi:AcrR family transcriptional regulator